MKFNSVTILAMLASGPAHAFNFKKPVEPSFVEGFNWKDPFSSKEISSFKSTCESTASFDALEYTLHNLMDAHPDGLKPWGNGLKKVFSGREYPGGWAGLDRHLHDRSLLLMNYDKVPIQVREWIEEQERTGGKGKALFAVFERPSKEDEEVESVVEFPSADKIDRSLDEHRVAIFAPGALYGILPLWAAGEAECKDTLLDLAKYKPTPQDGGVAAWVSHTKPKDKKKMDFTIEAKVLKAQETGAKKSKTETEGKAEKTPSKDEL